MYFCVLLFVLCNVPLRFGVGAGVGVEEPTSTSPSVEKRMSIERVSVESELVPLGGNILLTCHVANMDSGKFVRFNKLVPSHSGFMELKLTTNRAKEETINNLDRFNILAVTNEINGYNFILNITDVHVEDSGIYSCCIPASNISVNINIDVIAEPTLIQFYVNDQLVANDNERFQFDDVTDSNLTCVVDGGNPEPLIDISSNDQRLRTDFSSTCQVHLSSPAILSTVTCVGVATVTRHRIDYLTSGRPLTCTAKSRGAANTQLSMSFTPFFVGGVPVMSCDSATVMTRVYTREFHLLCNITSNPPLTDAFISWSPSVLLRPVTVTRPGVTVPYKFHRDGDYLAYLLKAEDGTMTLKLVLTHVFPQMFRQYTFTATNNFGSTQQLIQLVKDPTFGAVKSRTGTNSFNTQHSLIVAVILSLTVLLLW